MTNTMQKPDTCSSEDQKDLSLDSLEVAAELERIDRQAGQEYLPMDVFINTRTMKEHFRYSSIRAQW